MAKIKKTQPKLFNGFQTRDLFQTPNYATELLIPFIPEDIFHVWECASGEGKIAKVLHINGYSVLCTDLRKTEVTPYNRFNFLTARLIDLAEEAKALLQVECIITNPPFSIKDKFVEKCFEYELPFALLINADYGLQSINWIQRGCEKIIPTRRIDFITPTGLSGLSGHTANFHSFWLTRYFNLGATEIFVELTNEQKKNI